MTINEAIEQGIRAVRCQPWNPYCRMELPEKLADGTHGPWGYIIDPPGNLANGDRFDHKIAVLLAKIPGQISVDSNADEWEEWEAPPGLERFEFES